MTPALAASAFDSLRLDAVPDQEALRRAYEFPSDAAVRKQMTELTEQTRRLIGCSSLVLVASVDAVGNCDVSPRGGPAGFVAVLDAQGAAARRGLEAGAVAAGGRPTDLSRGDAGPAADAGADDR